jgi:hypothetical protein
MKLIHSRYYFLIRAVVASLLTCFYTATAYADQTCDFIALDTVTAKFPQSAPWRVTKGGSGACDFEGQKYPGNPVNIVILKFTQLVQETPAEAVGMINAMKPPLANDYNVEANANLGNYGFYSVEKGKPINDTVWWWAHRGRTVLSGLMVKFDGERISVADRDNLSELISLTLTRAATPAAQAKATQCPYFDNAILKKLLPSKELKVQQYGSNSCTAEGDNSAVVMLTSMPVRNKNEFISRTKNNGSTCVIKQLTGLGDTAFLLYACKNDDTPTASIAFFKSGEAFNLTLIPGKEPTAPQRADLAALGRHIYGLK